MSSSRDLSRRSSFPRRRESSESRVCGDKSLFRAAARKGLDSRLRGNDGGNEGAGALIFSIRLLGRRAGQRLMVRRCKPGFLLFLAFLMLAPAASKAQGLSQLLGGGGGGGSNDVTGEIFRALQQRLTGQSTVPSLQPDVQIQNPPTYPSQYPGANGAFGNQPQRSQQNAGPMSPIEKLMSQRAGQPIRQFGYDIFGRGAPVIVRQSGALQDSYVLGEGDEIVLTLRGQQNSSYRTRVDRDGRVVFPALPPVSASGRAFGAFRADLEAAARQAITGTEALVSVGAVRQISVRVVGEVNSPGLVSLSGLSTAMDALSLAGGVKSTGSLRDIQIVRNGGGATRLDLYTLLMGQANGADVTLTEGDRIVVPLQKSAVAVVGQVKRPGVYELPPGQSAASISEVLALAGGTEVHGSYRFSILRTREDGKREMVQAGGGSNISVRDGDLLFVAANADVSLARVKLMGSTNVNGYYPLNTARSLRRLLTSLDMFSPMGGKSLPYLLIDAVIRLDPSTMQRTVIPFSPIDVIEGKADLPLQSNDVVYVMNVAEMRYIARRASAAQRGRSRRVVNDHPDNAAQNSPPTAESAIAPAAAGRGQPSPADNSAATLDPRAAQLAALQNGAQFTLPPGIQGLAGGQALAGNTGGLTLSPNQSYAALTAAVGQDQADNDAQNDGPPVSEEERANPGIPVPTETAGSDDAQDRSDGSDQASRPSPGQATSMRMSNKRDLPRIFVGLDDDARRLLVSTLGNYYVTVVGEVNNPGDFLAMPRTTLDNIVLAAGGLTPKVDLHAFEITSADTDNASGVSRTVRKNYDLSVNQFAQVMLKPYDRIRFNSVFSDRDSGDVSMIGEVKFPGGYEILRGEHLSSVLARAGGFTDAAYPAGAIFLRRSVAEEQRGVMQREADALERQVVGIVGTVTNKTQVSDAEIGYVAQMIARLRQGGDPGGRVAVQIDPQEVAAHPELDVVMEPGDQLFIPRRPSSVVIAGEVMSPGGIQYRADRSVSSYVALAGGFTEISDDDHMFVIQPDGSAVQVNGGSWLSEPPRLAPGSIIVVPRRLRHFTWDTVLEDVIQVTSQMAITAASLSIISR